MQMKNFKEDFPLLRENPVVYLDSAATAQRPESVINSEMEFYKKCNANPLRGLYDLGFKATECYEQSRETVRKFINARSEREIIFTRNATESLNLVAYSYGMNFLKKGRRNSCHCNGTPQQPVAMESCCRKNKAQR